MAAAAAARILGKGSLAAALSIGTVSVWKQPETQCERPQTLRNRVRSRSISLYLLSVDMSLTLVLLFR